MRKFETRKCRKSSEVAILRAIAGLEKLDAGTVHLDGRDATADSPADRDLAMVFQSYALCPRRTAYENIASPLRARPRAFLMDEPLTNLDLQLRVEMRTELTRIHRSLGGTFVYVTNDQVEALSMADQVAVLRQGRVQQVGTPTEVYERPANRWVAAFVGSPRISLLACQAQGDRLVGAEGWTLPRPPGPQPRTAVRCCSVSAARTCPSNGAAGRRCPASSTVSARSSRRGVAGG